MWEEKFFYYEHKTNLASITPSNEVFFSHFQYKKYLIKKCSNFLVKI